MVTGERFVIALSALAAIVCVSCGVDQAALTRARDKVKQFHAEVQEVTKAQEQGDMTSVEVHQANAENLLREARKRFDDANAVASKDPQLLMDYVEVLVRLSEWDLSAEVAQRITTIDPKNAAAWVALGQARASLGHAHAPEATAALRRALSLNPTPEMTANALALMGRVYRQEGLYDLSRESYTKALQTAPDHLASQVGIAGLDICEGKMQDGVKTLESLGVMSLDAATPAGAWIDEAASKFAENHQSFPDTAENHLAYAKALIFLNRWKESLDPLERSLKLDPNNYIAWNMLGSVHRQLNDLPRAQEAFRHSLQINPDQPRTVEALKALDAPPAI
ncbi:MAG: tetratricopeptide repeat protein [Candidatus Hydrogenedentes bacterium]|nr:tetratricopeptide repeat protein [Candidatus Hydrogenedentota bacterium]